MRSYLSSPGFEPMTLGEAVSDETITGILNGSGFVKIAVTLTPH
jgi:hypothetical protein